MWQSQPNWSRSIHRVYSPSHGLSVTLRVPVTIEHDQAGSADDWTRKRLIFVASLHRFGRKVGLLLSPVPPLLLDNRNMTDWNKRVVSAANGTDRHSRQLTMILHITAIKCVNHRYSIFGIRRSGECNRIIRECALSKSAPLSSPVKPTTRIFHLLAVLLDEIKSLREVGNNDDLFLLRFAQNSEQGA